MRLDEWSVWSKRIVAALPPIDGELDIKVNRWLARKAAERAEHLRKNPPSDEEITAWARRLGKEAADLVD